MTKENQEILINLIYEEMMKLDNISDIIEMRAKFITEILYHSGIILEAKGLVTDYDTEY